MPGDVAALHDRIEADGGRVIGSYRDPLGGRWQVLAALPLDKVSPTPFQRDLSKAHVARLGERIDQLDRFLDPVIAVRNDDGSYWTPNGNHRREALTQLGARSIVVLVVPERDVAYQILALNTEKAHNLKEKSIEVVRMARSLAELGDAPESDYALQFEEPALITLGMCYEQKGRFAGSSYHPVLKRVDEFMGEPLSATLAVREQRAAKLLELDEAVNEAVAALKERGFQSPYLKAFDAGKVKADQVASASGPPAD